MQSTASQNHFHEQWYQRRQLDHFFAMRDRKQELLFSMPRLVLGDSDPRAKSMGVYILTMYDASCNRDK